MKASYIVIPALTIFTAWVGNLFTSYGMDWYRTINLPAWTPDGGIIGAVWTVIFILTAISAIIVWNKYPHNIGLPLIVSLFILNAVVNVAWSWLFFGIHQIGLAFVDAILIELSVLGLIFLTWHISKLASLLLVPYAGWVAFASYLTYVIWRMNG